MKARRVVWVFGAAATITASAHAQSFPPPTCGSLLVAAEPQKLAEQSDVSAHIPADVDGDGVTDEVTSDGATVVITYHGPAAKPPQTLVDANGKSVALLAVGELNGTAGRELVVRRRSSVEVVGADAAGALKTIATLSLAASEDTAAAGWTGHFRNTTTADLLLGDSMTRALELYFVSGSSLVKVAGVESLMSGRATQLGPTTVIGDTDGDGLDDVVFDAGHAVGMARLGARATWDVFKSLALPSDTASCSAIVVGDFDGDGRRDVIAEPDVVAERSAPSTWLQTATGDFRLLPAVAPGAWSAGRRVLVGDLDKDGRDDFVTSIYTGRLVGDTWMRSIQFRYDQPLGFDRPLSLFDWDGDGFLEYTAIDSSSRLVRTRAARADLEITVDATHSQLDVSKPISAHVVVKNHGPTATMGLALSTNLPGATFSDGSDFAAGFPNLVLSPDASYELILTQTDPKQPRPAAFEVSVCSGAPDPSMANNTIQVPVTASALADVGESMSSTFLTTGEFGVTTYVKNDGPAMAYELRLTITMEPGGTVPSVESSLPDASCTSDQKGATCTLAKLPAWELWYVSLSGLHYNGNAVTITSSVDTGSPDPEPKSNTYVMRIPAGLKPAGAPPSWSPDPSSGATPGEGSSGGGCGCTLGRRTVLAPWGVVLALGVLLQRRRRWRTGR